MTLGWSDTSSKLFSRFKEDSCKWWYNKCALPLKNSPVIGTSVDGNGNFRNTILRPVVTDNGAAQHQPLLVDGILEESRNQWRDDEGRVHIPPDNAEELRSFKIKIYPTQEQKKKMQLMFEAGDWSYDQAVEALERGGVNPYSTADTEAMRQTICNLPNIPVSKEHFKEVHSVPRREAARKALENKKIVMKKGRHLELRSEKKLTKRCAIVGKGSQGLIRVSEFIGRGTKKVWSEVGISKIGKVLVRDRAFIFQRLWEDSDDKGYLKNEGLITYDRKVGVYHLVVRFSVPVKHRVICSETARVVALDPGNIHFSTYYCSDGTHGELLVGGREHINKTLKKISSIQSKMEKEKNMRASGGQGWDRMGNQEWERHRRHQKRRIRKIYRKLECRRRNAHYNAANFLLSNYDVIIAPKLKTREISEQHKIPKSSVRTMFGWASSKFQQILKDKSQTRCDKYVRVGKEPGTSGTCGRCLGWNKNLGASRTFRCPNCNAHIDRDVNGARNNLLAELTHFIVNNSNN